MKAILALVVLVAGIALAFYVGGYLMFVGGIIQVIQSVTPVVVATGIGFGIGKVFFAGFVGWFIGFLAVLAAQLIAS